MFFCAVSKQGMSQTQYIDNGSFENYSLCPSTAAQINRAYWTRPIGHTGSSDYFNGCNTGISLSVPNNFAGSSPASQGVGYLGARAATGNTTTASPREYISDTLTQALLAGQTYIVSFEYRLASKSRYATDDMGYYLSTTHPTGTGTGTLGVVPTSQNASGNFLSNSTSWTTYIDTIIAAGGELFITIGSFDTVSNAVLVNTLGTQGSAYYYYDEVSIVDYLIVHGDSFVCEDSIAEIYAVVDQSVYWVDSLNPNTVISTQDTIWVSPDSTTTYLAIGNVTGDTFSWTVEVVSIPTSFVGSDSVLCEGDTFIRSVNMPGYTYLWSDGGTDSVLITMDSGYHSLTIELHGCYATDSFHLEHLLAPQFTLGNDTTLCDYDSIELSTGLTSGTLTFEWNDGSLASSLSVNDSGIYWVDVSNVMCTARDSISVFLHPHVSVDLGSNEDLCYLTDSTITVNSQPGNTITWSTAQTGSSITVSNSGSYYVTATNNGCFAVDSVELTFHNDPVFSLGNDTSYCKEDSLVLTINLSPNSHDFLWNNGAYTQSIVIKNGTQGLFWAQADNGTCHMRDSIHISEYPRMNLELGGTQKHCKGDMVTIQTNTDSNLVYVWNDGSSLPYLNVTESGSYSLTVSDGQCQETDKVGILFFEYPEISIGNDTVLCAPEELHFTTISNAHSFRWYNGSISDQHVLYVEQDTTIWVKASNTVCASYDSVTIDLHTPPSLDIEGDTLLCQGKTVLFTVAGDSSWSYVWSDSTKGMTLETAIGGTYTLTVSDGICSSEAEVHASAYTPPNLEIMAPEYICAGEQAELSAAHPGMYYYQWSDLSHDTVTTIYEPGFYWVEAWDDCGISRDTVLVQDCECYLRLPTAFRPTPAGVNQTFGPKVDCEFDKYEFIVFDRWGEVIFHTKSVDEHWDGTYRGVEAQSGSYGWKIDYKAKYNGQPFRDVQTGAVILLR